MNGKMGKQIVVYLFNEKLRYKKQIWYIQQYKMNLRLVQVETPDRKGYILCESIYITFNNECTDLW